LQDRSLLLPRLVAERAQRQPDRIFIDEVGGPSLSYSQYNDDNLRWADALRRVGVAAGDRVVTMLPSSAAASSAWLGLSWLRAVEVPCNIAYKGRMLEYLVRNCEAETMVVADAYLDRLAEVARALPLLRTVVVMGTEYDPPPDPAQPPQMCALRARDIKLPCRVMSEAEFFADAEPAELPGPEPYDICALFYTSGTTGNSKGVLTPWAQLYAQATGYLPLDDFGEDDAWYMPYPMNHISGKTPMYSIILVNGRVVVRDGFDTNAFWSDIDEYRCSSTGLLGTMPGFLWQQEARPDDADHVLENVWMAPLVPYLDEFKARFGVRVTTSYGSVEHSVPIHAGTWDTSSATWRSCGKVRKGYPGYDVRVVDEHDYEVGPGEIGELIVRTSEPWTMTAGYLGMPEKTAEVWKNGWFHTGDAFTYDDEGNMYFVDRTRDCIRRRGENISSFEVEAEVNAHPLVAESAAIGVPSDLGEEEIKVLVVTAAGADLSPEDLTHFLIPRIPRFMLPRYVEFVPELPKTDATMRVKKYLLRDGAVNDATWDREVAGIKVPR
jgi:crotonobetaine/carnitine-CoA ligase